MSMKYLYTQDVCNACMDLMISIIITSSQNWQRCVYYMPFKSNREAAT